MMVTPTTGQAFHDRGKDGWMERVMIWMRDARQARDQRTAAEDCP